MHYIGLVLSGLKFVHEATTLQTWPTPTSLVQYIHRADTENQKQATKHMHMMFLGVE